MAHFPVGLFPHGCVLVLRAFWRTAFYQVCPLQGFPVCGCVFILWTATFKGGVFYFNEAQLINSFFYFFTDCTFGAVSKKPSAHASSYRSSPLLLSWSFIVLCFTLSSVTSCEWILGKGPRPPTFAPKHSCSRPQFSVAASRRVTGHAGSVRGPDERLCFLVFASTALLKCSSTESSGSNHCAGSPRNSATP